MRAEYARAAHAPNITMPLRAPPVFSRHYAIIVFIADRYGAPRLMLMPCRQLCHGAPRLLTVVAR